MPTAAQIALVKKIQSAFNILALLNINGHWFPEDAKVSNSDTYDFIVAGGGTAGVVVAARLVEANFNVLLIEAGCNSGLESNFPGLVAYVKQSRLDWNFITETDKKFKEEHNPSGVTFGKTLGGSGFTNWMIYGRGNRGSYERFYEATNDTSWKWENMLKYFLKSENLKNPIILNSKYKKYHSDKGTIAITKENRPVCNDYLNAFKQAGEPAVIDNIGTGTVGYSTALYYVFDGNRTEAATSYLPPLKNNPRLHISRNSMVTKLIIDDKKTVVGVEFVKYGRTYCVNASKEVIVSAGTVKSPQLLMLSGIGPKEELQKWNINVVSNIPVGKNLRNDIGVYLAFKTNKKANPQPFNAHEFPAPLIVGYGAVNKSNTIPDYETLLFLIDEMGFYKRTCGFSLSFKESLCDKLCELADKTQIMHTIIWNMNPKSCGEVLLNCTDPFQQPKIISKYFSEAQDLDNLATYVMDYVKIMETSYFKKLGVEFLDATKCCHLKFGTMKYWRCYIYSMYSMTKRHVGTCSMGAVVDSELKVKGVKQLRVIDASVFPNPVGGMNYASVVALAEKGAEMIVENYKC